MTKPPPRTEEYSNRKSHHKPSSTPASYFATLFLVVGFQLLLCFRASIYCNAFPIVSHLRSTLAASAVVPTSFYSPFVSQLRAQHGETDARTSSLQVSDASARLDPLLTSFLLRSVRSSNNDNGDDTNTDNSDTAEENGDYNQNNKGSFTFSDASKAMIGLQVWDMTMRKARLPLASDFQTINSQTNSDVWPEEPLFSRLHDTLSGLALPRLIRRHPEILTSVLLGVAKLVIQYTIESRQGKLVMLEEKDDDNNDDEYNEENDYWDNYLDETMEMEDELSQEFEYQPLSLEELERLAESLATDLTKEWGGVVQGVSLLDKTFGYDHGLLDLQGDIGFGLEDGVWQHNGWQPMPELQKRLASMPELRELLSRLGRRPSSEGREMRKFRPRKRSSSQDDMMGVELDIMDPTSVSGLTRSGSLTNMLPSEAVLLRSSIRSLRWLFLAKKAESKLLSYELSGWADVPTKPLPRARRSVHLPSAAGGPLIICLDTSWSMSGIRESLSKAVVLASVKAAHEQGRECRVVSFSSSNNAVESGTITCDANGVRKLLDFLSYSFGGGTDVTGALKFAMDTLENDMASSDLLLVTDGELPNPPVSKLIMAKLESLKQQTGMEVHGLLVGKKESMALNMLCNEVHDFLADYETFSGVQSVAAMKRSLSAFSLTPSAKRHSALPLTRLRGWSSKPERKFFGSAWKERYPFALQSTSDRFDGGADISNIRLNRKDRKTSTKRGRFDDDDDDWDSQSADDDAYFGDTSNTGPSLIEGSQPNGNQNNIEKSEYVVRVEDAFDSLQEAALTSMNENKWVDKDLQTEINRKNSLWSQSKVLSDSISFIELGLVERDVEARLVVLGMVSQEHVLFIGPPGTSKSELGRRLSQLCGGPFFQRLFTRFTTPEEIFGPLSLRALENDQYTRCIDGFLPTASIAFLDEIFKANSAILNTLLTILNERQFDNGAGTRVQCPLKCVIGASNELPETEELDALLDRFLLRAQVLTVSDAGLLEILSSSSYLNESDDIIGTNVADDLAVLVYDISSSLKEISMDQNICILIRDLRTFVRDELGVYISDRRLVKASRLLRVSASTHGRSKVDFVDCLLLTHMMWQVPDQRDAVREWLWDHLTPGESDQIIEQSKFLLRGLSSEYLSIVKTTMGDVTGEAGARADAIESINSIQREIADIENLLRSHKDDLQRHTVLIDGLGEHLWIGKDESHAAKQHLLPLAKAATASVNQVLTDTIALKLSLSPELENDLRSSIIEMLLDEDSHDSLFTEEELEMSLKEAKRKFDGETLRKWKSARKD